MTNTFYIDVFKCTVLSNQQEFTDILFSACKTQESFKSSNLWKCKHPIFCIFKKDENNHSIIPIVID